MAESLRQKQSRFARSAAHLILKAYELGYEVTLGEAMRSPAEAKRLASLGLGIVNSVHTIRLAIDLNLFKGGKYLTASKDYEPLGAWWESQGGSWGGRFKGSGTGPAADGGHFSFSHNGRK